MIIKYNRLELTPENVNLFALTKNDITFTHAVFAQCFLPLRKPTQNAGLYKTKHGKASLAIQAGLLLDPNTGELNEQQVPYGAAARLIMAHIHNYIIRAGSLEDAIQIPMGNSLREFFDIHRLKIGGKNAKQITQQIRNIAAARITIGVWQENHAVQINVPTLAEEIHFWIEKDDRQRCLWQPTMILNRRYAEVIRERSVPIDMRALVGLYEKPRAMDIFTWLSYRLPNIKEKSSVFVPFYGDNSLHSVFGAGIVNQRMFRKVFIETIKEVHLWYPAARLQLEENGIRLFRSPSPVPNESLICNHNSPFFIGD